MFSTFCNSIRTFHQIWQGRMLIAALPSRGRWQVRHYKVASQTQRTFCFLVLSCMCGRERDACRFSESKGSAMSPSMFYSEIQNFQRLPVGFLMPKHTSLRYFQLSFFGHMSKRKCDDIDYRFHCCKYQEDSNHNRHTLWAFFH